MTNLPALYLAVDGATKIMQDAVNVNQDAIASWDDKWLNLFDSQLFNIIIYMSTFAGVVAITVWMVEELRDFDTGDLLFRRSFYVNLFWAIFVMAMLVPNGNRLAALVQGLHSFGQQFNQQALEFQLNDIALEDAIRATVARGTLQADISAQAAQCEGLVGERQFACLSNAHQQVKQMIEAYQAEYLVDVPQGLKAVETGLGAKLAPENGADILNGEGENLSRIRNAAISGQADGLPGVGDGGFRGALLGALGSTVQALTQGILLAMQWAFVNLLELAMLLTALVSPFALALSFLPGKGRPIIAWVIAYTSMVMVQFYYNIMIGIMANVVLNSNAYDINGFLIIMAIFGPVLAMKLAQGGGMAVFDVITSGTVGLALASAGIAAKSAPTGARR
ncbi:MAG: hypothetical protein DCF25_02360 [Leptolyngbya foveolarum]|uniref:Uncharacterized protein n=1 Tax=Leptolyngbya foveolarum TaxID=47253 RepID=A0A2W4UMI4_9CYAN|nr:MAG: hypothetical protein DCF25_02360 [Leptolyngbya foveolarum]